MQQDPRYWQQIRRQSPIVPEVDTRRVLNTELRVRPHLPSPIKNPSKIPGLDRDWAMDLGSGASIGAGNYPAKYSFDTSTADCTTDFVVYPTGLAGAPGPTTGQATLVAYNNLYSGCGGIVPSVYWAYNTGTGSTIQSSPVFSVDGTQLAFVQADASLNASLVLLKWVASGSESVTSPGAISPSGRYSTCFKPCLAEFSLTDAGAPSSDTNSSVFYDYSSDTAYVGDDTGYLHQFNPVFKGTPAEVTTGGWPVQVNPTNPTPLASPVFDSGTGNVFVTDQGGFLYSVTSAGVVTTSGELDYSFVNDGGPGIVEGPVVNSTAGFVYVFAASDNATGCSGGTAHFSGVYELSTTFIALDTGSEATVGCSTPTGSTPNPLYVGAFDSTYVSSTAPSATGKIYVCGNTGGPPILYQVAAAFNLLGSSAAGPTIATTTTPCSPVTDILNPNALNPANLTGPPDPTEWIYASVGTGGLTTGCGTGCIFNFVDTQRQPATSYAVGQEILDNNLHIEVVETPGVSSSQPTPLFGPACTTAGATTTDGAVVWLCQSSTKYGPPVLSPWAPSHHYTTGAEIIDANKNIELVTSTTGVNPKSGTSITFATQPGVTTVDNQITWTNVGAQASAALPASGGASGLIIDNFIVGTGAEAGASQVYFTTLSDQVCGTSGTGGCAVQASQSALH